MNTDRLANEYQTILLAHQHSDEWRSLASDII
jgi:hypothetical protein